MVNLIVTIFLGPLGVHKFMQKKNGLGFLYLFTFGLFGIGWIIDVVIAIRKIRPKLSLKSDCLSQKIYVAGTMYRKNEISSVMSGNKLYLLPDEDFIRRIEIRKNVYRFKYREADAKLIPEPTNPHDPNAIMVLVDNVHIGYIPADQCEDIKKKLHKIKSVTVKIYGGDYRYHTNNEVFKAEDDFSADLYISM